MAIYIYGIKNCNTMRKTFDWFDQQQCVYTFVDYKKTGVVDQALTRWLVQLGWETLLNRKGLTWRRLEECDRLDLTEARASQLICAQPSLIKRPVVEFADNATTIGFVPNTWQKYIATR